MSIRDKIMGESKAPIRYSSVKTRMSHLEGFLGGAIFSESGTMAWADDDQDPKTLACETDPNYEVAFRSGVNRTDLPSAYGPADVTRVIGPVSTTLWGEIAGWMRFQGQPFTRK